MTSPLWTQVKLNDHTKLVQLSWKCGDGEPSMLETSCNGPHNIMCEEKQEEKMKEK